MLGLAWMLSRMISHRGSLMMFGDRRNNRRDRMSLRVDRNALRTRQRMGYRLRGQCRRSGLGVVRLGDDVRGACDPGARRNMIRARLRTVDFHGMHGNGRNFAKSLERPTGRGRAGRIDLHIDRELAALTIKEQK